jgi:hypothetical protein
MGKTAIAYVTCPSKRPRRFQVDFRLTRFSSRLMHDQQTRLTRLLADIDLMVCSVSRSQRSQITADFSSDITSPDIQNSVEALLLSSQTAHTSSACNDA